MKDSLRVTLTSTDASVSTDVSSTHLFVGYKPLVIAIPVVAGESAVAPLEAASVCLNFHQFPFEANSKWYGHYTDNRCIARILLKNIGVKVVGSHRVSFFTGTRGEHTFIAPFHQFMNRQREKFRSSVPGNVDLPGNLYDMVRIAYAVPRVIPIISVREGSLLNMFPTDLHGAISNKHYISSLRINGKANSQVESTKRLAISCIDASAFRLAYRLGKNHMRDMTALSGFECATRDSLVFRIPLPAPVLRYRELALEASFDVGIHRIHTYEIVNAEEVHQGKTLAHIHQYYAQWRIDHGLPTELLLR